MALSNKKIKYIKNTAGQKSIKDLSIELNVPEFEIEEVLNSIPQQTKKTAGSTTSSATNLGFNFLTGHNILMFIQAILIALVPLISMGSGWYDFANLAQGLYIQSISGFMLFFWLLDCVFLKQFEIKKSKLYYPIIGILTWSGLSFLWATNLSECLEILSLWVACSVIFFVLFNMIKNSFDFTLIMLAILSSLIYLIIIGMIQFFDPTFNWYNQVISPSGTFGNKNMFCDYIVIVLPLCFYFFLSGPDKSRLIVRILSGIIFCSGILLIIFSMTRAGMLTCPILLALLLTFLIILKVKNSSFHEIFSKQKIIIFATLFFITTIFLTVFITREKKGFEAKDFGKRINSIFNLPEKDKEAFDKSIKDKDLQPVSDSTTIRLITWANTLKMIQDKPLHGFGLYNWQIHYGEYRRAYFNDPTYMPGLMLAQLHNDYLQILADLGLIGFLLFVWLIWTVFVMFKKLFFSQENELETKLKALSLILCIVGFGIICNFSFLIVKSVPTFLLFSYIALLGNLFYYSKANSSSISSVYSIKIKLANYLLIPVLLISILVTAVEINRGIADQLFKTAMDTNKQQKYDIVIENCQKILDRDPLHYKTHFVIANAYMSVDNFEKAVYHIEYGLQFYPNDLYALFQAGTIYIKELKDILEKPNPDPKLITLYEEKAQYWYGKAFKIREDFGKAWNNLGFLHEKRSFRFRSQGRQKDAEEAIKTSEECFNKAISQNPQYTDALLNKANIMQNTGRGAEIIPIAKNVLEICTKNLNEKDAALKKLEDENFQKNSGRYNEVITQRISASYEYMSAVPKAILMLKIEYSKTNDYKSVLDLFDFEKRFLIVQLELKRHTFKNAENELVMAKNNAGSLRFGITLSQLEKSYNEQKIAYAQAEADYNKSLVNLLREISDAQRQLGKIPECLATLNQIIELSVKSKGLEEIETIARLQINAIYLSVINQDLIPKFPIIQENFDKATYQGSKELINHKIKFMNDFENAKKMLKKE